MFNPKSLVEKHAFEFDFNHDFKAKKGYKRPNLIIKRGDDQINMHQIIREELEEIKQMN